jgi:tetratricopeptide (TPR) repeat protein
MTRGRFDEARTHLRIASELDPQSTGPLLNQALNSLMSRDEVTAIKQLDAILAANPRSFAALVLRNAAALLAMDCPAASTYSGKIAEFYPNLPAHRLYTATVAGRCGHPEQARAALSSFEKTRTQAAYASPYQLAAVYAVLDNADQAIASLQESANAREPVILYLKIDPTWDQLRPNPRFQALERTIGLLNEK